MNFSGDELNALQALRARRFQSHGVPDVDDPRAADICFAIDKVLPGKTQLHAVHQALVDSTGVGVNTRALRAAFLEYSRCGMLPHQPKGFYKARRSLADQYGARVEAHGLASANREQLQALCSKDELRPRDGIELAFVASPPLPAAPGTATTVTVTITNRSAQAYSVFQWDVLGRPADETQLRDAYRLSYGNKSVALPVGGSLQFTVTYRPRQVGKAPCLFIANLGRAKPALVLPLECASSRLIEARKNLVPYVPARTDRLPDREDTIGEKPESRPPKYRTPIDFDTYATADLGKCTAQWKAMKFEGLLTVDNYAAVLHVLWQLEEHQMRSDLHTFSMAHVPLTHVGGRQASCMLKLDVPGLAERRPSVLKGDRVKVRDRRSGMVHVGFVHYVQQKDVLISFHRSVHERHIDGARYDVEFVHNGLMVHKRHAAIDAAAKRLLHLLLPDHLTFRMLTDALRAPLPSIFQQLVNLRNTQLNREQQMAVNAIVKRSPGLPPFIVFGPPGTGKTSTLVEAITQVYLMNPDANILVCAPSNAAVDVVLCKVVASLGPALQRTLFRANAAFRLRSEADAPKVMECSLFDDIEGVFRLPADLRKYRVVFSTLAFAQTVIDVEGGYDQVDYVFIDEAGHADECEILMCLGTLARHQSRAFRLFLAGDPFQLGPIIHNKLAEPVLGISLLERLMKSDPYRAITVEAEADEDLALHQASTRQYNSNFVVKLTDNYRSHPDLLAVPAALFYDHYLKPCANHAKTFRFVNWDQLPNPNTPFIFHGVRGQHQQEGNSPSYCNLEEVEEVCRYVEEVLAYRSAGVAPKDIGIISPYVRQCEHLRRAMQRLGYGETKVGTVEAFQGDERSVIIISTVRSDFTANTELDEDAIANFVRFDRVHNIGFLNNPKRFNVAVTRAQSLLVVVGNPFVLQCDRHWKSLLTFALRHSCYTGLKYSLSAGDDEAKTLVDMFQQLGLDTAYQRIAQPQSPGDGEEVIANNLPYFRED